MSKPLEFLINVKTSSTIKTKKYYAANRLYKAEDVSNDELKNGGFIRVIEKQYFDNFVNEAMSFANFVIEHSREDTFNNQQAKKFIKTLQSKTKESEVR